MERKFCDLLQNLQGSNRNEQCATLKDIAFAIQDANRKDLQDLLELLNTTPDTELQVKLFSILAAYLLSKNANCEIIITCKPLYDKIQDVLNGGLPLRTSTILNFILALLSFETEDSQKNRNFATFARNMLRVSGCLTNMSSLLTSGMMYQDAWIALCHSFAEVCRGSEVNQSYCSHLVPFCVQSCLQGNSEVYSVLQSLLQNHERNIKLFLDTNGISIFTRESLQHNTCMLLLNTIVQKSSLAISLILEKTNVIHDLRGLLRLSGPFSQIGQWSTIILYHLDSGIKKETETEDTAARNTSKISPTSTNKNNIDSTIRYNVAMRPDADETRKLVQNVIREVFQWKSQYNNNFKIPVIPNMHKESATKKNTKQRNDTSFPYIQQQNTKSEENIVQNVVGPQKHGNKIASKELSFSSMFKQNFRKLNIHSQNVTEEGSVCFFKCGLEDKGYNDRSSKVAKTLKISNKEANSLMNTSDFYQIADLKDVENKSEIYSRNFKPTFMSTPKRQKVEKLNQSLSRSSYTNNTQKVDKICKQRRRTKPNLVEKQKQRSMSERLLSAINDSCTTFVKSVKRIFKTKEYTNTLQNETINFKTETNLPENGSCSYSFTDYMRKRDAILASNYTNTYDYDDFSIEMKKNSCKTCSDTMILRSKLVHNEHLRKTLMKLKIGINLYGCDFKKISKVMWPRERYMTPKVLHSLYRKLILKE